jgi:hypothetical protein
MLAALTAFLAPYRDEAAHDLKPQAAVAFNTLGYLARVGGTTVAAHAPCGTINVNLMERDPCLKKSTLIVATF